MSNLNSKFDVYKGWPNGSALELSVHPAVAGITEGKIVSLSSMSPVGTAAAATVLDPSVSAEIDMFVDPHASADFVTAAITDDHVLDTCRNANADMVTLTANQHIFLAAYAGAKNLRGVVGKKRIRTTDADAFTTARTAQACSYFVRPMILKSEDPASTYLKADLTACNLTDDGAGVVRITKGATSFANAVVGDVCVIANSGVAGYNGAWIITSVAALGAHAVLALTYSADDLGVATAEVYHPVIAGVTDATCTAGTQKVTKAGAFTNAQIGDMAIILHSTVTAANIGTWYVSAKDNNTVTVEGPAGHSLADQLVPAGDTQIVLFRPVASRGAASVTVRKRITRLYDTGNDFITTSKVTPGKDQIVMPWPTSTDATHWDTTTTRWEIASVVDEHTLAGSLGALEELAPEDFVAPYAANAPYRIDLYDDVAKATAATSSRAQAADGSLNVPDQMWLVVQGNDQYDGSFTDRVAMVKVQTGIVWHVSSTIANTLVPGDLVYSNAGTLAKVTRVAGAIGGSGAKASNQQQPVGMVIYSNNTAGALGEITVVGI